MQEKRRSILAGITLALLGLFYIQPLVTGSATTALDGPILEAFFRARGARTPLSDIAIIGVAESSLARSEIAPESAKALGDPELQYIGPRWPWDRRVFAGLIQKLIDAKARMIIVDFVLHSSLPGDEELAAIIAKHRDKIVLACVLRPDEPDEVYYGPRSLFVTAGDMTVTPDIVGFANITKENGRVRRYYCRDNVVRPLISDPGLYTLTALAAIRLAPETVFPTGGQGDLINFAGPAGTYEMISVENLFLHNTWNKEPLQGGKYFRDKIVIVGPYAGIQFKDVHQTSFGDMPGPEIHANQLASVLQNNFLREMPVSSNILITFLVAAAVLFFCFHGHSVMKKVLPLIVLSLACTGVSLFLFLAYGIFLPLSGMYVAIVICGSAVIVYDFVLEQHQRLRIHSMFGTYVSREVVDRMVSSGEAPQLGGQEMEITSFFSDVQGFSALSEQMSPGRIVDLMNEYLTAMTDIFEQHGGTLDKYVGDSIVGMFGAPVPASNHALQACLAGLEMQKRQLTLQEKWASEGDKWPVDVLNMRTRIGLNTGMAIIGNMGSKKRFNYTSMGDTVNLASRCEGAAGSYGVYIMVTEATRDSALKQSEDLIFRLLDRIIVKGRSAPESVYELMGRRQELTDETFECLARWNDSITRYHQRQWGEAIVGFERCRPHEPLLPERNPGVKTSPCDVMIQRCRQYLQDEPGKDWDGVYIMRSKK